MTPKHRQLSLFLYTLLANDPRVGLDKRVHRGVPHSRPDGGGAAGPDGAHPELESALLQVVCR